MNRPAHWALVYRYGSAAVAVAMATALRLTLDPLLGNKFPFAILLLGVLIVAAYAGRGPGLLAASLGAVTSAGLLLSPRDVLWVGSFEDRAGLVLYLGVATSIALLGGALRRARLRAMADAEGAARQREQFRITLSSIGDGVLVVDAGGRVASLNPIAEGLTGWSAGEAAGQPLAAVFRIINEETRLEVENPADRALREGVVVGLANHTLLIAKDGTERPIDDSAAPIRDELGRVSGAVLIFRDISARRDAERTLRRKEEKLRVFVEHAPVAVAMFDREMRYLRVSRRWRTEFELGDIDLEGRCHYELFPDLPGRWKEVHRRVLAGAVERADEDPFARPDGREEWHRWEARPWRNNQGEVGGIIIFAENITEQVRSRRLIREHARTLSGILAASVDNIYVVDREGRYKHVSAGGARVMGFERGEMEGKHWSELGFPSEVMRVYAEQFAQVFRSGIPAQHETRFAPPGGDPIIFEYIIAPVVGEGGQADSVVVISRDVTAHRLADQERLGLLKTLETRNAFIQAVLSEVPAAIIVADAATGQILLSNAEAHRIVLHEYDRGRTLDEYGHEHILEASRPDGRRYGPGDWPLERAIDGETVEGEEIEMLRRDGSRVTIRANAGPIRVGGEVVAAVVAFHDISESKAAERAARFLADASAALSGLVEYESTLQRLASLSVPTFADWAFVDLSDGGVPARRLAVAHADPSKAELARKLRDRYPLNREVPRGASHVLRTDRPELMAEITDAMLAENAKDEEDLRTIRELAPKSCIAVPLAARGETLGVLTFLMAESGRRYDEHDLAVAEDLAARAAIAIENARLYGELKEADRRKNEFLATLAHELRNPLAPIRNALHLMKRPVDGETAEAERAMAERQVVHLARLIDDLMDVARISRGRIELHKEIVDLATIVAQAVETSRPQVEEHRHRLTVSLPSSPIWLEADPTRLEQILWNLLNNAAKYSEPGGRIHLAVEPHGPEVLIRLKDSGIGIKPEMLESIFEMFTQAGAPRGLSRGGLGIGLSLVRTLVELQGGSIAAHSDGPGQGSEFVIRLPRISPSTARDERPPAPDPVEGTARVRRRILVVDDNEDAARSLSLLLSRMYGHETQVAHDGPSALDLVREFRPEVVLLDIGLPGMDGYDVARTLRMRDGAESLIIVALTGWGQQEDRRQSRDAGFDHHLVKPVDPSTLDQLLNRLCSGAGPEPRNGSA